jgi:hypothetical protein
MPRPFHPKRDIAAQEAFKKTAFQMLRLAATVNLATGCKVAGRLRTGSHGAEQVVGADAVVHIALAALLSLDVNHDRLGYPPSALPQ